MKTCPGRYCLGESNRVRDRARPQGWMIKPIHAAFIRREKRAYKLRMFAPQFAECAAGLRERAMDQDKRVSARGGKGPVGLAFQRRQSLGGERVNTLINPRIEVRDHFGRSEISGLVHREAGDDVDRLDEHVTEEAARSPSCRNAFLESPLKSGRYADFSLAEVAVGRAPRRCGILLGAQQVPGVFRMQP